MKLVLIKLTFFFILYYIYTNSVHDKCFILSFFSIYTCYHEIFFRNVLFYLSFYFFIRCVSYYVLEKRFSFVILFLLIIFNVIWFDSFFFLYTNDVFIVVGLLYKWPIVYQLSVDIIFQYYWMRYDKKQKYSVCIIIII